MQHSIEIPVSIGLQNAQQQIAAFRQLLLKSVNVDSSAFKEIDKYLKKMQDKADGLKVSMSTAFKTPTGATNFLRQYEQLMSMIKNAGDKFTNFGVDDIAFSPEDAEKVKQYKSEIEQLQLDIRNLEKGKIGNIFEGDVVANADAVRAAIEMLKLSTDNLTFNKLSSSINSELSSVEGKITSTSDKLQALNSQISAMSDNKLAELTDSVKNAVDRAIDPKKSTFNSANQSQYAEAMARFYSQFENYTGKTNYKTTGNVETFRTGVANDIAQWAEKTKSQLKNAESVIQQLETLKRTALSEDKLYGTDAAKRGRADELLKSLGLDIDPSKIETGPYETYITNIVTAIRNKLRETFKVASSEEVNQTRDLMLEATKGLFEGLDVNQFVDTTALKASVSNLFKAAGIDESGIKAILSGISDKLSPQDAFKAIIEQIDAYKAQLAEKVGTTQEDLDKLTAAQAQLKNAAAGVSAGEERANASLDEKHTKLLQVIEDINQLVDAYNKQFGTNLHVDLSGLEKGKESIESFIESVNKIQSKQKSLSNVQMAVNRWMGFWQVLNMTKTAVNDMKKHIQELDSVMTSISVVTNFSQEDLWGQISQYSQIARQYGVAIKGVYEVSQIYYQQGLQQNDVMTLTTETLKMARIAGLDYATAADYMTTAIRGFKLEMTDAAHVTDVFSALAATTASSTEEIAVAISKTAASAEAVGSSFEATSAMMSTMIATTRESATNIGTALKSVISRYGEMTSDPSKTVDSEGEEMSLNRVDKALQTVGITIHDTARQFRDFDDVMLELMEKWDSLDSLSQRYIATLMAGNRQQSRFLALVSNVDEYKKALQTAMNSEGTGELQTLKTLDSVDAKIEKMKVTIQEFYTSSGLEKLYKNILDIITNVVSAANSLPKELDNIPVLAASLGVQLIASVKSVISLILAEIQLGMDRLKGNNANLLVGLVQAWQQAGQKAGEAHVTSLSAKLGTFVKSKAAAQLGTMIGSILQLGGSAVITQGVSKYGASTSRPEDEAAAKTTFFGTALSALGGAITGGVLGAPAGPWGVFAGVVSGIASTLPSLLTAINMNKDTLARQIELSKKAEAKAKENLSESKGKEKGLEQALNQLNKLKAAQYDSAEAAKEYTDYMNQLGDQYPDLIDSINQIGDAIINATKLENALADARLDSARATVTSLKAELGTAEKQKLSYQNLNSTMLGLGTYFDLEALAKVNYGTEVNWHWAGDKYAKIIKGYNNRYNANIPIDMSLFGSEDKNKATLTHFGVQEKMTRYYQDLLDEGNEVVFLGAKQSLRNSLDNFLTENKDSNLLARLGFDSLDSLIGSINSVQTLRQVVSDIQNFANEHVEHASNLIDTTNELIKSAVIDEGIQDRLKQMQNSGDENQRKNALILQNYADFLSFIYSNIGDTLPSPDVMNNLEQWILGHKFEADKLLQLDYSVYRNFNEIGFSETVPPEIKAAFEKAFNDARTTAKDLYDSQLTQIFGDEKNIPSELNATKFNNKTLSVIQSDLSKYSSMLEGGNFAGAEAYLNNIIKIYTAIGAIEGPKQDQIFSVIKDLDLSSPDDLRSAADMLTDMGGEFAEIAPVFTDAAERWAINAVTSIEALSSSAQETAKSIESSIADMSKVFKYSEALEKAQTLIDANKDKNLEFDQLYRWDEVAQGYIKTSTAFQLEMDALQQQQFKSIEQSIEDYDKILTPLFIDKKTDKITESSSSMAESYNQSKQLTTPEEIQTKQEELKNDFANLLKLDTSKEENKILLDRYWNEYTQMLDAFYAQSDDSKKPFDEFVREYLNTRTTELSKRLEEIQKMPQEEARRALSTFDYASIASGKGTAQNREELKALLTSANRHDASDILRDFDKYYLELLKGNVDEYNKYLEHYGLGNYKASESEVNRARFESMLTAVSELGEDKVYEALSGPTKILLKEYGITDQASYTQGNITAAVEGFNEALANYINSGIASISEVASYIDSQALKSGIGKQKVLMDAYSDQQFSTEELIELGAIDKDSVQYDEERNVISYAIKDAWKNLITQNEATGAWDINQATRDKGQKAVIEALANAAGIKLDLNDDSYFKALESGIEADNKKQQEQNSDLVAKSVMEQLSNANVGNIIDAHKSDVARSILTAAGFNVDENGQLVIANEQQLRDGFTKLEEVLNDETQLSSEKADNPETIRYLRGMVASYKANHSKYDAISGALDDVVTRDAAEKLASIMGHQDDVDTYMTEELGFVLNENGSFLSTIDSIDKMQGIIDGLTNELATESDSDTRSYLQSRIAAFQATLNDLRNSKAYKQVNSLTNLLGNYTDVTNQDIEDFKAQFSELANFDIESYLTSPDANGKRSLKMGELRQALMAHSDELNFNIDQVFSEYIGAYADAYTKTISDAIAFSRTGTTSRTEMEAFIKDYNALLDSGSVDTAFEYNISSQSWKLKQDFALQYIYARGQQLGLIDQKLETYVDDLLKTEVSGQIDQSLDNIIDGQEKDTQELTDALLLYYKKQFEPDIQKATRHVFNTADSIISQEEFKDYLLLLDEQINQQVENTITSLRKGGIEAVNVYKQFKPNATEEELAKIYSSVFDHWSNAIQQLSEITEGSFVTGRLREVLDELKMLDGGNIVNSTFDMVTAYRAIYERMSNSNGTTISGLNEAYAELLTIEDRQGKDAVDMLKNASGMSYDELGKILTTYGLKLEEVLKDETTAAQFGLRRNGLGQVQLTNWEAFAQKIFNTYDLKTLYNNPEYISAYHSYIDGLITMNETAEDIIKQGIKDEFDSLGDMKRGDALNFSYLDRALNDIIEHRYDQFTTNNIGNLGNRVEVSPEVMNETFGRFDWFEPLQEGEYSTLFGRTFTGADFEGLNHNIGISAAQIDNEGKPFDDVQSYIQGLIDLSLEIFHKVNADTLQTLDSSRRKIIMDIHNYDEQLDDDTIWNSQDEITQAVHEAEELPKKIAGYKDTLAALGATFENGILDLSEDADLINIADVFQAMINDSGLQLADTAKAALEDSIQKIISTYTESITKGIEGGLTSTEANELRMQASDLGIPDITFEQTVKGLQLSQKSAIKLYQAMAKVDAIQGKLLFDKLAEHLSETNENFASTETLLGHIVRLRDKLNKADDNVSSSRLAEYQAELAVAKEIVAIRSTQEDDSFNFMSNKIPGGQNNPLNYAKNLAQAMQAINDAYKVKNTKYQSNKEKKLTETGYMGYEQFYNIVTELNNMAGAMGHAITIGNTIEGDAIKLDGTLESASQLILKGIDTLTAMDGGEMMVNIGSLGLQLAKGGNNLKDDVQSGIEAIADAQISALDGIIAMMELIVAMESLDDIAGKDMKIKLGDIVVDGEFTDEWKHSVETLREYYDTNKDFQEIADGIVIDNKKFMEWIDRQPEDWSEADAAFLSSLYQAAKSTDWNIDKVADSLQGILASNGFDQFDKTFSLTLNDISYVVSHGVVIEVADWTDKDTQAALASYMKQSGKDKQTAQAEILTALENYSKGEGITTVPVDIVLTIKHSTLIQYDEHGSYVEDSKGNKHYYGSEEYDKTVNKAVMEDVKAITSGTETQVEGTTITTTYGLTSKCQIHMTGKLQADKSMQWEVTEWGALGKDFEGYNPNINSPKSQSALLEDIYNWGIKNDKINVQEMPTKEIWIYQTFGMHFEVQTEIFNDQGQQIIDPTKNTRFRAAARAFRNKTEEQIQEAVNNKKDGTAEITVGDGFTMKVNWDEIASSVDPQSADAALVMDKILGASGGDLMLKDTIVDSIRTALKEIPELLSDINTDGLDNLASALTRVAAAAAALQLMNLSGLLHDLNGLGSTHVEEQQPSQNNTSPQNTVETNVVVGTNELPETVESNKKEGANNPATQGIYNDVNETGQNLNSNISTASSGVLQGIGVLFNKVPDVIYSNVALAARAVALQPVSATGGVGKAAGTVGLAHSKGTLMGELGPELVVSQGRYFVVGQNGPEMVDLADDAIVFNHLQTESLLTKGMSSQRGRAVTNEREAVSFAKGSINGGPAMASSKAALHSLKELRAMWQSLKGTPVTDLAGIGGGGGGGSGGGKIVDPKAWVKTVERWYNLTQEIAKLEKQITHEETLRSKLQSDFNKDGNHYYKSQQLSLKSLREQIAAQEQLNLSRQDYYQKRIDALQNEPLGKLYSFDENGQLHFRNDINMNGQSGAMNFLTDLMGFDKNGKANYTNEQKYNILKQFGFDEYMQYNSNGEEILLDADHNDEVTDEERETYYQQTTEAWRDRVDNYAQETQSLWDAIKEGEDAVLEAQTAENEILEEMRENQIEVEEDVLKAIEDMRQRQIDALQEERDKLEDSTGKFIQGLTDALNREQEMYDNEQQANELNQQRRRLAILQRSGGSAADIANLQQEIDENERSQYFDLQQQEINAIQEASNLQLSRMDEQIELMTETLEYQKEYGLLWNDVYNVMSGSAAQITSFISGNSEFWSKSPLSSAEDINEILFKAEQWTSFRDDLKTVEADVAVLAFATREEMKANDYKIFDEAMKREFGDSYDKNGAYKELFYSGYTEHGDLTKITANARQKYIEEKQAADAAAAQAAAAAQTAVTAASSAPNNNYGNTSQQNNQPAKKQIRIQSFSSTGKLVSDSWGPAQFVPSNNKSVANQTSAVQTTSSNTAKTKKITITQIKKKASGGYANHGIYELGERGTETVFTASQTKVLRDNILSNRPNSLISLLKSYNEGYSGINNSLEGITPVEDNSVNIERIEMTMEVKQIANDYDARRAGDQAINEIMRIARKAGATNSIRR